MQEVQRRRPFGEVRRRAFLTIRDLSEMAGVSSRTIVDLEHGRTYPQLRTIKQLSEALNVDPLEVEEFAAVIEGEPKKAAA
jgi:transcriptional regulator with XRE-family HTH domain